MLVHWERTPQVFDSVLIGCVLGFIIRIFRRGNR